MNPSATSGTLRPFNVTLRETPRDNHTIEFNCQADDAAHAKEQAENAYPAAQVLCIHDMSIFPHELVVTVDPTQQDRPSIGFHYEGMEIADPFTSACGRFIIEPAEYGLDHAQAHHLLRLNEVVAAATDKAIEQATALVNQALADEGREPQAGFFQGVSEERNAIQGSIAAYMVASMNASYRKRKSECLEVLAPATTGSRIGEAGITFTAEERPAFPGVTAWWNAEPLPLGQVCVHDAEGGAGNGAIWIESSKISIRVFGLDGAALSTSVVVGRAGLNDLYEAFVGHRPDDDAFEPDAVKLLARVCEAAYRHATGDAN